MTATAPLSTRSSRGLDWTNFFLADVRDGVGPYLGIYLLASHNWDAGSIGVAMSAMGIAMVFAQTPAGAFIDNSRNKRLVMAIASLMVGAATVGMTLFVNLPAIILFQIMTGVAAAVLLPGLAAITLGLVGYRQYAERQGRNEVFNHAGNVVAALIAGLVGHCIAREFLFYAVAVFALLSMVSVLTVRGEEIDNDLARGAKVSSEEEENKTSGFVATTKTGRRRSSPAPSARSACTMRPLRPRASMKI